MKYEIAKRFLDTYFQQEDGRYVMEKNVKITVCLADNLTWTINDIGYRGDSVNKYLIDLQQDSMFVDADVADNDARNIVINYLFDLEEIKGMVLKVDRRVQEDDMPTAQRTRGLNADWLTPTVNF